MELLDLWLPILVSAVFVFIASSVLHMVLPVHKGDYGKFPGETEVMETMRKQGVQPGGYMLPCPSSMKDMATPEMTAKYEQGPVAFLTVLPNGMPNVGKSLISWFVYTVFLGAFVAYVSTLAGLGPGTDYKVVFRLTGTVAILAYATAEIPNSIWKGAPWTTTLKFVFDGVVYGLVTGGTFGWLWPDA